MPATTRPASTPMRAAPPPATATPPGTPEHPARGPLRVTDASEWRNAEALPPR